MQSSNDQKFVQRLFTDYLLEGGVDGAQQYALSGRQFKNLADDELVAAWVTAVQELAKAPLEAEKNQTLGDLGHELTFRGIEPPHSSVEQEWSVVMAATRAALNELMADPVRWKEADQGLRQKLTEFFVQKMNREQN